MTTIQTDTAAVLSSMGLSQSQITQIQSDQSALATAMQTAFSQANGTTSSSTQLDRIADQHRRRGGDDAVGPSI